MKTHRKTHETLFNVCSIIVMGSLIVYAVSALWLAITTPRGAVGDGRLMLGAMAATMLTVPGFTLSWWLRKREEWAAYKAARLTPSATLRIQPIEGRTDEYAQDVLWWFHNGPELRQKDEDFERGFNARALVPPPKRKADPMRYTKKPVTIEAVRFIGISAVGAALFDVQPNDPFPGWLTDALANKSIRTRTGEPTADDPLAQRLKLFIGTSEGVMRAREGDWIIRGIEGELYPCQPSRFEAYYALADDGVSMVAPGEGWTADDVEQARLDHQHNHSTLARTIAYAINYHSRENGSDTPDWILAEYLERCLDNFDLTITARKKYYGEDAAPVGEPWKPGDAEAPVDCPLQSIHEDGIELLKDGGVMIRGNYTIGKGFDTRAPIGEDDQD